jgi:hypothetical protein
MNELRVFKVFEKWERVPLYYREASRVSVLGGCWWNTDVPQYELLLFKSFGLLRYFPYVVVDVYIIHSPTLWAGCFPFYRDKVEIVTTRTMASDSIYWIEVCLLPRVAAFSFVDWHWY